MPGQCDGLGFLNCFGGDVGHFFTCALHVIGDELALQIDFKSFHDGFVQTVRASA